MIQRKTGRIRGFLAGKLFSGHVAQTAWWEIKNSIKRTMYYEDGTQRLPSCCMEARPHFGQMDRSMFQATLSSSAIDSPAQYYWNLCSPQNPNIIFKFLDFPRLFDLCFCHRQESMVVCMAAGNCDGLLVRRKKGEEYKWLIKL